MNPVSILFCLQVGIEGNPFIIRFKTHEAPEVPVFIARKSIEGNPFIIRFKTSLTSDVLSNQPNVLKVIHL